MTLDDIREIFRQELQAFFAGLPAADNKPVSIAQQAINLARQGDIEGSKALLKAYSKKRAA